MTINRVKFCTILAFMFLFTTILPVVSRYLDIRVAGVSIFSVQLWKAAFIVTTLFLFSNILTKKNFWLLFYYGFVIMIISNVRRGRVFGTTIWFARIVIPLLIVVVLYYLFIDRDNPNSLKFIVVTSLLMILVSCLLNIRGLLLNPLATRMIIGEGETELLKTGVSGYGFHSGLPPLIPPLILWAKKQKKKVYKFALYGMAIIVMATAFLSSIAASLLLAVAGFALAMFGQNFFNKGYSAIVIIGLALFFIVVPPSVVISKSLLGLAQVSPSDTASRRIIDLESVISSGIEIDADTRVETTAEGRIQRYYYNYEVFMRNPLFGDSRAVSGDGHLFWAHQLAFFGIVGFSALMLILTAIVRAWLIHLKGDYRFFFWLSLGLFIAMGLMKVILGDFMFFIPLFLSPAILFYVQYQENTGKSPSANAVSNE